jgi:hypothetical protein
VKVETVSPPTQPDETLSNLAPDEVFKKLTAKWDKDQMKELITLLANHLEEEMAA